MSRNNPYAMISVRIWPEDARWMARHLDTGQRSDFIRQAIRDAIRATEDHRHQRAIGAGLSGERKPQIKTIVKERLERITDYTGNIT